MALKLAASKHCSKYLEIESVISKKVYYQFHTFKDLTEYLFLFI